jgi:hypothetical protein
MSYKTTTINATQTTKTSSNANKIISVEYFKGNPVAAANHDVDFAVKALIRMSANWYQVGKATQASLIRTANVLVDSYGPEFFNFTEASRYITVFCDAFVRQYESEIMRLKTSNTVSVRSAAGIPVRRSY